MSKQRTAKASGIRSGFPIVGIGASAGGLEACSELMKNLPPETGMAFILVQHLDPKHESLWPEILSRTTQMPVREIKNNVRVKSNHVYVIPPNRDLTILRGTLNLIPRPETRGQHMSIDFFFESLAQDQKSRAIGVVLSGIASDGTHGLKAIKAEGGITVAQDPKSAKYDGMPTSAIRAGVVDLILPPEGIAKELARVSSHPYVSASEGPPETSESNLPSDDREPQPDESLRRIFLLLRNQTHVDFSIYKYSTVHRRIERRMLLHKMGNISDYSQYLGGHPEEVSALYNDILINVTEFFRDSEAFKALKTSVFPVLLKDRGGEVPIRIWVPGCATGEETYSLAISLLECLGDRTHRARIQFFATDISEQALQKARVGIYPESSTHGISKERLKRFFDVVEGGHKINKMLRDMCLFSRHDVTSDPPFSKLDLVSCRNLLIYFSPLLQKRVIPVFHYALNPKGFLWLGRSETPAGFSNLFAPLDKANRIYSKIHTWAPMTFGFPRSTYVPEPSDPGVTSQELRRNGGDFQKDADRIVLSEYAPAGVVVNNNMEILQFRGRTTRFLEPAPGQPSHNLLKMARPELLPGLRMTIHAARKQNKAVRKEGIALGQYGKGEPVSVEVVPTNPMAPLKDRKFLVLFESEEPLTPRERRRRGKTRGKGVSGPEIKRITQLEHELNVTKENQASFAEEYEISQEELTSANEELQSGNEELQSTNEELETSKEELQSANEELTTVNDELQNRQLDLTIVNNDLINLLSTVEIAIVMVGKDHRIRRFTPKAGTVLKLIPADVGRPIGDIKPDFDLDLDTVISEVVETMIPKEVEVQDRQGRWSRLQVRPYKTIDHKIDGAVLALVDITSLKQSLKEVVAVRNEAEKANRTKDLFLATLSHELRTPLTTIIAWGDMLRLGKLGDRKATVAGEKIVESGKAQAQLINDLLDISRIVAGKVPLELQEVNPAEILTTAIEAIRSAATSKSITIDTFFDSQSGTVRADPIRLQQVFWNLLSNAVKFSAPESKIAVRLEKIKDDGGEKAKAQIKVVDSGKGISPEFLPHIFETFSQEDASSIRLHGGLGLGLAIVKNLVELHGGSVHAESPGEKKGAVFTVILPLVSNRIAPETQGKNSESRSLSATNQEQIRLDGLRVLLVDDEANTREAISETLLSLGVEIKAVESAREAMELFPKFKPHVLVSDIAMPGEDGYTLIKNIRALGAKRGGQVPAVALTAYAGPENVKRALSAGFQVHLAKPFDAVHLAEAIAKVTVYAKRSLTDS